MDDSRVRVCAAHAVAAVLVAVTFLAEIGLGAGGAASQPASQPSAMSSSQRAETAKALREKIVAEQAAMKVTQTAKIDAKRAYYRKHDQGGWKEEVYADQREKAAAIAVHRDRLAALQAELAELNKPAPASQPASRPAGT